MSSEEIDSEPPLAFTAELVIQAYAMGCFPMADSREGEINWYRPDPRAVLPLDQFHIPKSLQRRVRSGRFTITSDLAFHQVIQQCALPRMASAHFPEESGTWINDQIIDVYTQLNDVGLTHSIEAWLPAQEAKKACLQMGYTPETDLHLATIEEKEMGLVGGLYGLALGTGFFGESMFSRATDSSRVCLVHLVSHLKRRGYTLLDTQIINPHMAQFGVIEVPDPAYERMLVEALGQSTDWWPFCDEYKS